MKQVGHVDVRPLDMRVQPAEHNFGGRTYASLVVAVPSRLTWKTRLPDRGVLRAIAALPDDTSPPEARFRVGISDERLYEGLGEWVVTTARASPEWRVVTVDLSRFSGRHLSVLFPPTGREWRITLSIDATAGAGAACWADVGIDTDARSARTFFKSSGLTRP